MTALNRKLIRDLWRLRGQVLAIALVVGSGVAVLLMSLSSLSSLRLTADAYYERYSFADIFMNVKRAPERLAVRIAAIPGVQAVETRISAFATLDIAGVSEPVLGRLISVPRRGEPVLNRIAVLAGRNVAVNRLDEVVVSEPFAEAHGLEPGDKLKVVMNGAKRTLDIVGIALSPEFVYAIAPGALMPDDEHYGILWMGRDALEAAYDLEGAFNDVSLALLRGANEDAVIDHLDALLERYGGIGAIAREDQISNWFLMNEFKQLKTMATVMPVIFLSVAAFLTNMVLARLIATERNEIAVLKAFGFTNLQIGWHYGKMAVAIAVIGVAIGWGAGAWLGYFNTRLYADFYRFPFLFYRPTIAVFALGALVSMAAALVGAIWAVRRAVALTPAEAMRPPAPHMTPDARILTALSARLDRLSRIVLRQIVRAPVRSTATVIGVAFSVSVTVTALQWPDSINRLVSTYFDDTIRYDMAIGLVEPQQLGARLEFLRLPGVLAVEPERVVRADLSSGRYSYRGAVTGLSLGSRLHAINDVNGWNLPVPRGGVVLGTKLAETLHVGLGDAVDIEMLEGRRPRVSIPVVGLFETNIGMPAYMNLDQLNRFLKEPPSLAYATFRIDTAAEDALFAAIKELPEVSATLLKRGAIEAFHETLGETILIFISFFVGFASVLGFGVIYNATRITLSERGRELATLRVLGFTRWEISYVLLGESALLIFAGLPLGCLVGYGLSWIMTSAFETELYRVPLVVDPDTYGKAILIALAAMTLSGIVVRRRLDHLDLISVLKTRE
jgi:putative ABC transport system permease protein